MQLPTTVLFALLPFFLQVNAQASGSGKTTRYWDCCKPSCAWSGKASLAAGSGPVGTCDVKDSPLTDSNAVNGCDGGSSYMCSDQSPYAVTDDLAYGYAAVNIAGGSESSWCCACYELTFTSTAIAGKKMIVQATNTGGDLGANQFDLAIPGGGVGIFNGCTTEFGAPSSGWGAQYGGISAADSCSSFPAALKPGCDFRFGWFMGADNPTVDFKQVECPAALTKSTGCKRADDSSMPAADASGSAVASSASSTVAATSATSVASSVASSVVASSVASSVVASSVASSVAAPSVASSVVVVPSSSSSSAVKTASSSASSVVAPVATSYGHHTTAAKPSTIAPHSTATAIASAPAGDDDTCDAE
ncbi:glycoside hydrolase family 45 protein [Rutstroemia sp. NJR-2017a WRK4]|nr:glycoside hydrolase family 45 protein [Rutstroemia sp. NJR-2017a WRK4]